MVTNPATTVIMADLPMCSIGGGGGPPVVTFHILTEASDNLATEAGDLLRTE